MRGSGRTVFSGRQVEEFEVEILGVLKNMAPGQSLILARLAGGPLAKTGVAAGMSGSPVYLEDRLAGAIAYSFPFSTEPIAGIRPIHEMIERLEDAPAPPPSRAGGLVAPAWAAAGGRFVPNPQADLSPALLSPASSEPGLLPIATPVSLAGFSERT